MTATEYAARLMPVPIITYARVVRVSRSVIVRTQDLLVAISPLLFQMVMILAQSLQPGYNPLRDTISSMVWGPFGWLQTVNFFVFGALLIALIRRLRTHMDNKIWLKAGSILLFLVGVGFIILAICPTQSPGGLKTIHAIIHGITVYFITFFFPAGCFLLAPGLRNGQRSGFIFSYTIVTGSLGLSLIAFGVFLVCFGAHWFGMLERVLVLNGFVWLEIVGVYFVGQDSVSHMNLAKTV